VNPPGQGGTDIAAASARSAIDERFAGKLADPAEINRITGTAGLIEDGRRHEGNSHDR
jgi:hypothetical protein